MQKIVVITVILACNVVLSAGDFSSQGMLIGLNSATFVGSDLPGKSVRNIGGVTFGGFFSYRMSPHFVVQPELVLTTKGARINTIGDAELDNVFLYFEFPILVKYCFHPVKSIQPSIFCGPVAGLKYFAVNNVGIMEDIRHTDVGIVLGAGIDFWKMSLQIQYNRSLTGFDESEEQLDIKNSMISFVLGFSLCRSKGITS